MSFLEIILLIAGSVLGYLLITYRSALNTIKTKFRDIKEENLKALKSIEALKYESLQLEKYKVILDIEAYVEEEKLVAQQIILSAEKQAKETIHNADAEAQKIAGNAMKAFKNAEQYEKTAQAMKNIIDGYGDKYIIPTFSLLDQLAEDYSHSKAGDELKGARENMRRMIKNDSAAKCVYVEANRKQTAVDFVLDAFNGKVDTILSSVKQDNYGTLEQKIKDAFVTVNHNGKAFRDARITDEYLKARLTELKLACTVQAIKERDKEEQRQIREKIREEEKAAKEYEKAIKEAQKEEDTINKALEKAKIELSAAASEQQKAVYELKLKDLEQKLKEAEEKNQRAISMAQQTKTGHVYIISNVGSFGEDVLKIGMTRRLDPQDRVDELGDASVPFDFDVHAMIHSEDAPALEKELHKRFSTNQINKVNPRKEFFKVKVSEIKEVTSQMKIETHWTITAEAREYRETVSLVQKNKAA